MNEEVKKGVDIIESALRNLDTLKKMGVNHPTLDMALEQIENGLKLITNS